MSLGPLACRYWFADRAGLDALAAAIDPPDWEDTALPLTVFCDDEAVREDIAASVPDLPILALAEFAAVLGNETADYLQFAFRAIEDFGPGLELVMAKLETGEPDCLATDLLAVSQCEVGLSAAAGAPEACWIRTDLLRGQAAGDPKAAFAGAVKAAQSSLHMPLIAGAVFTGEPGDEAAQWRAQAAAAQAEIERLQTERRVRLGREAALKARHERDLVRQAEHSRAEIERLHQAAGWAGRWKARLARITGRK
jgi:hypothetical protein